MKVGDLVVLNSGSPILTVAEVDEDRNVIVTWFDSSGVERNSQFPEACLKPAEVVKQ